MLSIEEKEIYVGTVDKKAEEMKLRRNFGWQYVRDNHPSRSGLHIVLARDRNMPNYAQLNSLEHQYDDCKKQLKYYSPMTDSPEMFLLIFAFVFPFIIYWAYKYNQKHEYEAHNAKLKARMGSIVKAAGNLIKDGDIINVSTNH